VDLTPNQIRALEVVKKAGIIRPTAFARAMWPESQGWRRHTRCGPKGVHRGGGMSLAGGGYLGKLARLGYVRQQFRGVHHDEDGYAVSDEGRAALKAADKTAVETPKG